MDRDDQQFLKDFVVKPINEKIGDLDKRVDKRLDGMHKTVSGFPKAWQRDISKHESDKHQRGDASTVVAVESGGVAEKKNGLLRALPLKWISILLLVGALVGGVVVITIDLADGQIRITPVSQEEKPKPAHADRHERQPDRDQP